MFSKLHDRLGTAGLIVAIVALVVALTGTAFAAKKFITKPEAIKIAKKYAGKNGKDGAPGAQGAQGPVGPAGSAGAAGAKGATCEAGAAGAAGATGPTGLKGATGTAGAEGATGPTGADGATGPTGPVGPVSAGVLLKGTWSIPYYEAAAAGELVQAPISTSIPIDTNGGDFYKVIRDADGPYEFAEEGEVAALLCPGSADEPTVDNSLVGGGAVLCVYTNESNLMATFRGAGIATDWDVSKSGGGVLAGFYTTGAGVAKANGSWAFIAP